MRDLGRPLLLTAGLAGLWWLLSDGDRGSWLVGLPAVAAAGWAVWRLRPAGGGPVSVVGLLGFLGLFLWESARGGVDVARRTLAPRLDVAPGFSVFNSRLQRPDALVFFAACLCLLPGTLAARLEGQRIEVHLLDAGEDPDPGLRRLEAAVARLYPGSATEPGSTTG
jgi:multicomponent Na+:H+ antiporter subunit E